MPRLSARLHLLGLIAAAVIPVWVFAAFLIIQYALNERKRFDDEASRVAHQVLLVVEAELSRLATVIEGLSKSMPMGARDYEALNSEAIALAGGTDRNISLRTLRGRQLLNTREPFGSNLPPSAIPLADAQVAALENGETVVSNVYTDPATNEIRIAVLLPVASARPDALVLAISAPTRLIRDVMLPAVPEGWVVGVGDTDGAYIARSQRHEEFSGRPGLPEYTALVVGQSGTFTSRNFDGGTLLAGYHRSRFSNWFYTANVPLSVVEAPLWRSIAASGAIAIVALLVSVALAYVVGKSLAGSARELAERAAALGNREPVLPVATAITEFATISDALVRAERALLEREHELEAVLETAPAAVWFTYDPKAIRVIRNRYAAELMGLPTDQRKTFGNPDTVIDTIALKDGREISREDRPLSKAMRGEQTDREEFSYLLPSGGQRYLLSSARPIRDQAGDIVGAVQISLDITERKQGEEQRKLLIHELNHRVKNTLAVVQSIASQTLRGATDLQQASTTLNGRLVSLAKAHDMLTHENWSGADLRALATGAIMPHAPLDRFELAGGPVWLESSLALSFALAFHELITNAIKYGALSNETGSVSISWSAVPPDELRKLRIEWREKDGPPPGDVQEEGFGTRMLKRMFETGTGGSIEFSYLESGLVCVIEAVVSQPQT